MAADSSFDIVSKIDEMEVDNAFNQAEREIDTRFDFKNTGTKLEKSTGKINIEADTEEKAKAALEVLKDKLVKRGVSLKHLDAGAPQLSGKTYKIACTLKKVSQPRMRRRLPSYFAMRDQSLSRLRYKAMNFVSQVRAVMISKLQSPW
jgi:uncharacterized protein YajQ (UPF0234 family)